MKKQLHFILFCLSLLVSFQSGAQSVSRLVGASPYQDSLWLIDTTNFTVTYRLMSYPSVGGSITGVNGIAKNPNSGTLFMAFKQSAVSGRVLGKLNLQTGVMSVVGNLGDNFSSITFRGDSLFGVTGDGATVPETVYLIDTATAAITLYRALGNGADGEVISYNPADDMIYHWSGNGTIVYEKFSPVNPGDAAINIPIIGVTNGETFGSVYLGNNVFLNSNIGSGFNRWNANGNVSPGFGNSPDDIRGLAFYTCERQLAGNAGFCTGDSTELSVTPAFSYQWRKDGADIPGATSQTYFASTPGVYNVRVHDVCGTDTLGNFIEVQQNNLPTVALSGNPAFCANDSTTLSGSSGGTSQWYLDGVLIPGATNSTITVAAVGNYNMIKTNLNGCSDSAAVAIAVTMNAVPTVTISGATSFCTGDSVTLAGTSAGTDQWYLNGVLIPGATTAALTVGDSGLYNMVTTDGNGCSDSAAVGTEVTIHPLPVVFLGSGSFFMCEDEAPVQLLGSPAGGTYGGTAVTGDLFDPSVAGEGTFVVYYDYTDANGCPAADSNYLTVHALPVVTASSTETELCYYDGSIILTGSPAGGTFQGAGVTGVSFDPAGGGLGAHAIVYDYTDANGCSNSASFTITVDSCLAVPELNSWNLQVYPNPATETVHLSWDPSMDQSVTVKLVDVTGKIICTAIAGNGSGLSVQVLNNGTYWLQLQHENGTLTRKLIVLHP